MGCDKILLTDLEPGNQGNTYQITIRPQDRLIVTIQYKPDSVKTVTEINHIGISAETSLDGRVRFVSDWHFSDINTGAKM